jgi:hypothetical protein
MYCSQMFWRLTLTIEYFWFYIKMPFLSVFSIIGNSTALIGGLVWLPLLVAAPIHIFIRGLCISLTWGWFIAPVTGWRAISIVEGVGISIFFSVILCEMMGKGMTSDESQPKSILDFASMIFGRMIIGPLISLLYAWGWQAFFMSSPM